MKRSRSLYMMSIPAVALITVFVFIPLVSGIRISLTDWNGFSQSWSYVGFKNYLNTVRTIVRRHIGISPRRSRVV